MSEQECCACGAVVSREATVASERMPAEGRERVYGTVGLLCAVCFVAGYQAVMGT